MSVWGGRPRPPLYPQPQTQSVDALGDVSIDQRQISWRQCLQFSPPARVRNFHPKNSLSEVERARPRRNRLSASQSPRQQRSLPCGDRRRLPATIFSSPAPTCSIARVIRRSNSWWERNDFTIARLSPAPKLPLSALYFQDSNLRGKMGQGRQQYIPFPLNRLKTNPGRRRLTDSCAHSFCRDWSAASGNSRLTYTIALSFDCNRPSSCASSTEREFA